MLDGERGVVTPDWGLIRLGADVKIAHPSMSRLGTIGVWITSGGDGD